MSSVKTGGIAFCGLLLMMIPSLVFAGGGLAGAESILEEVLGWVQVVSRIVCALVIAFIGWKWWFRDMNWMDAMKVVGGAILVGGAVEISAFLLG